MQTQRGTSWRRKKADERGNKVRRPSAGEERSGGGGRLPPSLLACSFSDTSSIVRRARGPGDLTLTSLAPSSAPSVRDAKFPPAHAEIGWAFVPQYYNFVNKDPSRLHCFYTKQST